MSVEADPASEPRSPSPLLASSSGKADPVPARVIDARPGFRPRAWMDELQPLDAFGTMVITPRAVASLLRQIVTSLRRRKK